MVTHSLKFAGNNLIKELQTLIKSIKFFVELNNKECNYKTWSKHYKIIVDFNYDKMIEEFAEICA